MFAQCTIYQLYRFHTMFVQCTISITMFAQCTIYKLQCFHKGLCYINYNVCTMYYIPITFFSQNVCTMYYLPIISVSQCVFKMFAQCTKLYVYKSFEHYSLICRKCLYHVFVQYLSTFKESFSQYILSSNGIFDHCFGVICQVCCVNKSIVCDTILVLWWPWIMTRDNEIMMKMIKMIMTMKMSMAIPCCSDYDDKKYQILNSENIIFWTGRW